MGENWSFFKPGHLIGPSKATSLDLVLTTTTILATNLLWTRIVWSSKSQAHLHQTNLNMGQLACQAMAVQGISGRIRLLRYHSLLRSEHKCSYFLGCPISSRFSWSLGCPADSVFLIAVVFLTPGHNFSIPTGSLFASQVVVSCFCPSSLAGPGGRASEEQRLRAVHASVASNGKFSFFQRYF